jgi:hypothetical protein
MTRPPQKPLPDIYKVGYGKPSSKTRFRKGISGNPGGRPRGMTAGRAKKLALREAYRPITVREGEKVRRLPIIQAVIRQQARSAAKGNGPCVYRKLDSAIVMMQPAEQRMRRDASDPLNRAREGRVLV